MKRLGQFYCLTEAEYEELNNVEKFKKEYNDLLNLVARILPQANETEDKKISRKDFVMLHEYMVKQMDNVADNFTKENNAIYGHEITVHWHGFYCDCSDGAIPANNIIPAIQSVDDEEGDEAN